MIRIARQRLSPANQQIAIVMKAWRNSDLWRTNWEEVLAMTGEELRRTVLEVISELDTIGNTGAIQASTVLQRSAQRLGIQSSPQDLPRQQALLAFFSDLFRSGYLAWGYNLSNDAPPFCHITAQGRDALRNLSHDPMNPAGYLNPYCPISYRR